jgi:hypothetical protein
MEQNIEGGMYPMATLTSHFDLLTAEEFEEWARLRAARDSWQLWKGTFYEFDFISRMQKKYNLSFPITPVTYDSTNRYAYVDEYIRSRRRSNKLSGILDNTSNDYKQ